MAELYTKYNAEEISPSSEDFERSKNDSYLANSLIKKAKLELANEENILQPFDHTYSEVPPADSNKIIEENKTALEMNSSKTNWTYKQTASLIKSMEQYKDDFDHLIRRKNVYENVSNDMLSNGYAVDVDAIKNKWKSLTRSYTTAKDNKNRTGQGPSRFNFFNLMDEMLGSKPTNACNHSINSMMINSNSTDQEKMEPLQDGREYENNEQLEDNAQINILLQDEHIPHEEENIAKRDDKSLKLQFIQLKEKEYERRQQRHQERIKIERERLELENKKMLLLREYLKQK